MPGSKVRAVSKRRYSLLLFVTPAGVVAPVVMILVAAFGFRGSLKGYAIGLGAGVLVAVPLVLAMLSVVAVGWLMDRGTPSPSTGATVEPPAHNGVDLEVDQDQPHRPSHTR